MSFLIDLKPKDVAAARFVQHLHTALVRAFIRRQKLSKTRKADVARKLEVDRSQVSRWLNSPADMTLKSIGQLIWAIEGRYDFDIELKEVTHERPNWANGDLTNLPPISAAIRSNGAARRVGGLTARTAASEQTRSSGASVGIEYDRQRLSA